MEGGDGTSVAGILGGAWTSEALRMHAHGVHGAWGGEAVNDVGGPRSVEDEEEKWVELRTEDGKVYYWCESSGDTSWVLPPNARIAPYQDATGTAQCIDDGYDDVPVTSAGSAAPAVRTRGNGGGAGGAGGFGGKAPPPWSWKRHANLEQQRDIYSVEARQKAARQAARTLRSELVGQVSGYQEFMERKNQARTTRRSQDSADERTHMEIGGASKKTPVR